MLSNLPRIILTCLFSTGVSLLPAQAEDAAPADSVALSSGMEGGGYWNAGQRLTQVAAELDLVVDNRASEGSLDNLEQLLDNDSPVSLAFAQADALQSFLDRHPGEGNKLSILESIGQECVFVATAAGGELRTIDDFVDAGPQRLGISSATSGTAVTLEYLKSQLPQLAAVTPVYGDTRAAIDQLGTPDATVDAVMLVHRPRELSLEVEKVLAHPQRLRFVEFTAEGLEAELEDGRKVYRAMNLSMPEADEPVKTVCVEGLLLLNKSKLRPSKYNKLNDLVNYHWMRVYATQ